MTHPTSSRFAQAMADGGTLITALHDMTSLAVACNAGALLANGRVVRELSAADLDDAKLDLAGFEANMIDQLRRIEV